MASRENLALFFDTKIDLRYNGNVRIKKSNFLSIKRDIDNKIERPPSLLLVKWITSYSYQCKLRRTSRSFASRKTGAEGFIGNI